MTGWSRSPPAASAWWRSRGARDPVVACTTAVADGMVVRTESDELTDLRRTLLDLLLSDHRPDCLTCDKSGACRLQELAYRYGVSATGYVGEMRAYPERDDTPFIAYDPTKCILCGRCVGICQQVQMCHVLDFAERGFGSLISTSFGRSMVDTTCELCGNCVSACPTGALQDKLARFTGRTWEAEVVDSVCPFCGCGCNVQLHVSGDRVVQVTAPLGKGPNGGNLCVKGRYGYQFIGHPERLSRAFGAPRRRAGAGLVGRGPRPGGRALRRHQGAERPRRAGRLRLGALHQRGELRRPEVCPCGAGYQQRRPLRPSLTCSHRGRSGHNLREWSYDQCHNRPPGQAACFLVIGSNTTETHPVIALQIKSSHCEGGRQAHCC